MSRRRESTAAVDLHSCTLGSTDEVDPSYTAVQMASFDPLENVGCHLKNNLEFGAETKRHDLTFI